jgi:hypothetical protein
MANLTPRLVGWYRNFKDAGNIGKTIRDDKCDHYQKITYTLVASTKQGKERKIKDDERTSDLLQMIQATEARCHNRMEVTKLVVGAIKSQEIELEGLLEEYERFRGMSNGL